MRRIALIKNKKCGCGKKIKGMKRLCDTCRKNKNKEAHKNYYLENKVKIKKYNKKYRKENKERLKVTNAEYSKTHYNKVRKAKNALLDDMIKHPRKYLNEV